MIGLAVGIDYALFIMSRHRSQLAGGMEPQESAGLAVGTAGSAVVFAGTTVVIALAALSVVGIPFLTVMGLCAAGTVDRRRPGGHHPAARDLRLRRAPPDPQARIARGHARHPHRDGPARAARLKPTRGDRWLAWSSVDRSSPWFSPPAS